MRGEVALLSRNIIVKGHDAGDQWGCQIITSDAFDWDTFRMG